MSNSQLIAASRQIALQRALEVVANNVANTTTTGFRRRSADFAEFVMPGAKGDAMTSRDKALSFVTAGGGLLDMAPGGIERTGNALDIALKANVFLAVQTPAGERYTRNGALSLDQSGTLVTMDGQPVLTEQGPLQFTTADKGITIASDGSISTSEGQRGRLKLVTFEQPHALESIGKNLLHAHQPAKPAWAQARLESGALERSNVSGVVETTRLVEITRAYSSIAQMMQRSDEMRRNALTKLADLN